MLLSQTLRPICEQIIIVDVGAMPTTDVPRHAPLVDAGLADLWAVDCDPSFQNSTAANVRRINACLGDGSERDFFTTQYPGCSSLYEPDEAIIELFDGMSAAAPGGNFRVARRDRIQTRRLDDVLDAAPDLITIDAQGAERDILMYGARALESAVLVDLEVEFVPLYKGQPTFGDVSVFMASRGWMLHKLYDISGRCFRPSKITDNQTQPLSQILWSKALFVRNLGNPSAFTDRQLAVGAAILHDAYLSYDLAYHYVAELDRRNGGMLRNLVGEHIPNGPIRRLFCNESWAIDSAV
jgi:hypothetical protein